MRVVLAAYSTFSMTSTSMTESLPDESAPAAAEPMFFLLTCTTDSCLSGLFSGIDLSGLVIFVWDEQDTEAMQGDYTLTSK